MYIRKTYLSLIALAVVSTAYGRSLSVKDSVATAKPDSVAPKAESKRKPVDFIVRSLRYHAPLRNEQKPVMVDSTNAKGGKYTEWNASSSLRYLDPQGKRFSTIQMGRDSIYRLPILDKDKDGARFYSFYLAQNTYGKGNLSIEVNTAWELYQDGAMIASGAGAAGVADSIAPYTKSLTLSPRGYNFTLMTKPLPKKEEPKAGADSTAKEDKRIDSILLRIGYTPERKDTVLVHIDHQPVSYPDFDYMTYKGDIFLSGISPSGTYSRLMINKSYNKAFRNETYLYKGTQRIRTLAEPIASARWMPNEDKVYYTRSGALGRELVVVDPLTMEETVLAPNIPQGNFSISASGKKLIYHEYDAGSGGRRSRVHRFESPDERISGYGGKYSISIYDVETGVYTPLTFGNRSVGLVDYHRAEDRFIYAISTPTPDKAPFRRTDYYEVNLRTMKVDTLFLDTRGISDVKYTSRAGSLLVTGSADAFDYIGSTLPKGQPINTFDTQLFLYDQVKALALPLSKSQSLTISRLYPSQTRYEAYINAVVGDQQVLYRLDLASGKYTRLSNKEEVVRNVALASNASKLVYIGQSALNSDRFYAVDGLSGKETLVYDFAKEKQQGVLMGSMKDWDWTAPDGTKIQGRYYLPEDFDPNKKYPMLVYYYGGTTPVNRALESPYSLAMYASLGYVVYSLNPSGSTGYGLEFSARHLNAWGKRTADEIIGAVKDFTKAHSFVNAEKIGCMGASYGGFMTQYLQTQTDIFSAAVSHAGISSLSSYWGEGFWGVGYSAVASYESYPWNNAELYSGQSPLFLAHKINTPLLLIHGMADTNVPVGESWQMFNALRVLGKEVEFVGVDGEDHHILNPERRQQWTNAIMAFFAKYLQDDPSWWKSMFPDKK